MRSIPLPLRRRKGFTLIKRSYGNREKSGLAVEVIENPEPGRYDFKVSK